MVPGRDYVPAMELGEEPKPYMGEVRVKARLTNGGDQMLAEDGKLDPARVRSCVVDAMIDTGAVRSVIPESVARHLGVPSPRSKPVAYADGRTESVPLAGPLVFDIEGHDT